MLDKQIIFWLWLQCCLGVDNTRMHRIFESFDDAQQIYLADENELRLSEVFTEREMTKLTDKNLVTAKKIYNNCVMLGYDILSLKDKNYPKRLKNIPTPPVVIYIKGNLPPQDSLHTAIVGTRHSTKTGKDTAFSIAYNLAKNGVVIVSGGALGIDMQTHRGAIQAGGKTICVLGCGINSNYLAENNDLRNEIAKHGAVISEYPPNYPPTKYTFPKRNRIISGISDCTAIIEAGKTSGSLITAQYAVKQHRTVFAVPGSIENINSQGSNMLIKEGAKTLLDFNDILTWYKNKSSNDSKTTDIQITEKAVRNIRNSDKKEMLELESKKAEISDLQDKKTSINNKKQTNPLTEQLTDSASAVYDTISDIPIHVDDIKLKTNLGINKILIALTELEINGLIVSQSGRRYIRK